MRKLRDNGWKQERQMKKKMMRKRELRLKMIEVRVSKIRVAAVVVVASTTPLLVLKKAQERNEQRQR